MDMVVAWEWDTKTLENIYSPTRVGWASAQPRSRSASELKNTA